MPNCDDCNLIERLGEILLTDEECEDLREIMESNLAYNKREREIKVVFKPAELSQKQLDDRERDRKRIAKLDKYEIKFLGSFANGMKWGSAEKIRPKDGIYHDVGGSRFFNHLIPLGGTTWDKFSAPKKLLKIVRLVRD